MHVLLTCKNEVDQIKNEEPRVFTGFLANSSSSWSDGRISNSSELLWMSPLPVSMKKIRSKIKAGSAVAWWLMPRTPDPEVGGSSPTRVKPCCVLEQGTFTEVPIYVKSRSVTS